MGTRLIHKIRIYMQEEKKQKNIIVFMTVMLVFGIVFNGLLPKKYKLNLGDISQYDITAPREVKNIIKTKENQELAYQNESLDVKEDAATSIEVISNIDSFLTIIRNERGLPRPQFERVVNKLASSDTMLTGEVDVRFLLSGIDNDKFNDFEHFLKSLVRDTMKEDITVENLNEIIIKAQMKMQELDMPMELKNIGSLIIKNIIKPNRIINEEETQRKRESAYNDPKNIEMVDR